MPTIIAPDRQQITFMNKLDDMLAPDHPVRLLDGLIDRIIGEEPAFFDHLAPQESAGRRGYSAAALIKLFIYGYINKVNSSRALETEARRNIEVIWLLGSLRPSYKTIADYRKDHPEQIRRVNEQVVRFLIDNRWIDGQRIGIDGTKLKAYTGWEMSDQESLDRQLAKAHSQLTEWLDQLVENDLADERAAIARQPEDEGPPCEAELMEKITRLRERIERLEGLKEQLAESGASRISPADPDARVMRSARMGNHPAYNVQVCVDSAHKMIVTAAATNQPNDFELLLPMYWSSVHQLGAYPREILADSGYADLGDIQTLQDQTPTRCYIPENDAPKANREITFSYRPEADCFECSEGKPLLPVAKGRYNKAKEAYMDIYRGTECGDCPVAGTCTSAKDGIRTMRVFHGAQWRYSYSRQLAGRYGKERIAERKGVVEHVFGTLRYWMGQIPLKLRGLKKVQTEIDLYAAGYNLKRWFGLGEFKELMVEITRWQPAGSLPPG